MSKSGELGLRIAGQEVTSVIPLTYTRSREGLVAVYIPQGG